MNTMNLMPVIVSSLNSQDIIESVFYFSYIIVQKASLLFSFLDEFLQTGEVGLLVRIHNLGLYLRQWLLGKKLAFHVIIAP